jgi:hypothetical protein
MHDVRDLNFLYVLLDSDWIFLHITLHNFKTVRPEKIKELYILCFNLHNL